MAENLILSSIFERSLSLDGHSSGGDSSRAMNLWERMASSLDEIAANTRGFSGKDSVHPFTASARKGRQHTDAQDRKQHPAEANSQIRQRNTKEIQKVVLRRNPTVKMKRKLPLSRNKPA